MKFVGVATHCMGTCASADKGSLIVEMWIQITLCVYLVWVTIILGFWYGLLARRSI